MSLAPLPDIYKTAIIASIEASAAIMEVYGSDFTSEFKEDGSPITQADLASSKIISSHLLTTNIPITGEERMRNDYETRAGWIENWSVDPLDGTKMFIQRNDEFSINIAHIRNNRPIFGLIASPVSQRIILGGITFGVHVFDYKDYDDFSKWTYLEPKTEVNNPAVVTCSRSFTESKYDLIKELEAKHGALEFIRKGSALKFFELAEGRADYYLRYAPTMEWDIAAGQAIIEAMDGIILSMEDGKPLRYNKESLFNPNFIVKTKATL